MIIGIDIGGTKSEAALFDEAGNTQQKIILKSAHPNCATDAEMEEILRQCLLDDCSPIIIGFAGYGKSKQMRQRIERAVQRVFQNRKFVLMNDVELAMWSTLQGSDGIVLILGTGSIALKKKGDALIRKGGWGYLLGDEGSGYAIGRKILRKFIRQVDELDEKTELFQAVMNLYDLTDPSEIIDIVMHDGQIDRTAVAKCSVLSNLEENKYILKRAASDAAECVSALKEDGLPTYITGGMQNNMQYMQYIQHFLPDIRISEHEPVYGAYAYAKRTCCIK